MAPDPAWPLEESRAGTGLRHLVGHWRERPAQNEPADADEYGEPAWPAPRRWGRSAAAVAHLGAHLLQFWLRFRSCCTTRTRDPSAHADAYLRAQWTLDTARNCATLDRTLHGGDGQALPHFLSNSPWSGPAVCQQLQAEITAPPAWAHGRTGMRDERADEQAGTHHVGASRQDKGRLGQGAGCRVDPCLTDANGGLGALVAGELCVPAEGFGAAFAQRRQERGVPGERRLETKRPLALKMRKRVKAQGRPFARLAGAALYGRDRPLRADVDAAGVRYAAQGPGDTRVYLREPRVGMPSKRRHRGRPRTRRQVRSGQRPQEGRAWAQPPQTVWERVPVRLTERGGLPADGAVRRVWTLAAGQRPRSAWWVRRRTSAGDCS